MDVKINSQVGEVNEYISLIPIGLYSQKADIKRKIYNILKRGIDIIAGIFGVILMIPITAIIFITQKLVNDKGSVFYKQKRIGKNRKIL